MRKRISFWPIRIRFFKPMRGGFCPVSIMVEGKVNPVPTIASVNDMSGHRLKKFEALINYLLSKFRRVP